MKSKTSLFNKTIFIKNIFRFWPVWGFAMFLAIIIPIGQMISSANYLNDVVYSYFDSRREFFNIAICAYPMLIFAYAIIIAMAVWNYMYSARSISLFHSMPVSRASLYFTNVVSGLVMTMMPFLVNAIFTYISFTITRKSAGVSIDAFLICLAAVVLESFLFFGLAVFCAMLTGNLLALPIIYCVVNFIFSLGEELFKTFASGFLFGYVADYSGPFSTVILSPLVKILTSVEVINDNATLIGFEYIVLYGLVGILLLILTFFIYRNKKSESASEIMAFKSTYPVFTVLFTGFGAVSLALILYYLFGFNSEIYNVWAITICLIISSVITYILSQMILNRSFKVFNLKTTKGMVIASALALLVCISLMLDVTGAQKKMPRKDDIESVGLYFNGNDYIATESNTVDELMTVHKLFIDNKSQILSDRDTYDDSYYVLFEYNLKNGRTFSRRYYLAGYDSLMDAEGTVQNSFKKGLENKNLIEDTLKSLEEFGNIENVYLYGYGEYNYSLNDTEKVEFYQCLKKDIEEGNFTLTGNNENTGSYVSAELAFYCTRPGQDMYKVRSIYINLNSQLIHSMEYLGHIELKEYEPDRIIYQ